MMIMTVHDGDDPWDATSPMAYGVATPCGSKWVVHPPGRMEMWRKYGDGRVIVVDSDVVVDVVVRHERILS